MGKITYLLMFISISLCAQSFEGAYKFIDDETHGLWLFKDGYSMQTIYKDSVYIRTNGGPFDIHKNLLTVYITFDDVLEQKIGSKQETRLIFEGANFIDDEGRIWIKQPTIESDLSGTYRITGKYNNGKFSPINHTGSRMTLKILVDGYFQWIAFDSDKKEFFGTGGGDYSFQDGKYTEHLLFFSRDNSRVGATLEFNGEIDENDWHHKGKSSKGEPLHEVWTRL